MQGILQESVVSVVITDVIETEKWQNDGRTCKDSGGASALSAGGGGGLQFRGRKSGVPSW